MSLINEYRNTEEQIKELTARLQSLKGDASLQREIEFEAKLKSLMAEYNKNLREVIAIIDPQHLTTTGKSAQSHKPTRSARQMKVYKNPHNGEVIATKGGNHKGLNAWKQQYGREEVASWVS